MNFLYRTGFRVIHSLLGIRWFAAACSRASKIWLRHSQTYDILRTLPVDGVVDGGANVGEFASLMRVSLPGADLVCVEPHPGSAEVLRKDGYRVVEAALWKEETTLDLSQPLESTTSCTVMPLKEEKEAKAGETEKGSGGSDAGAGFKVKAVRLDQLQIRGERLLIKLDLQGAELHTLEGMGALWDRCIAFYLEVSFGKNGTFDALSALMKEHGFVEYATLNLFMEKGIVTEADKLWIRKDVEFVQPAAKG